MKAEGKDNKAQKYNYFYEKIVICNITTQAIYHLF